MDGGLVNGVRVEEILSPLPDDAELVERIAERRVKVDIAIVEYDPKWPEHFETLKARILAAFEAEAGGGTGGSDGNPTILALSHTGSTSVPGLPAKAIIDIDLVLSSNLVAAEPFYVPRLEAAGFQFLLREPAWYEHRFFAAAEPMACNLHVFGPRCAMVERHRVFRDWLSEHGDDRELYARVKRECAAASRERGEGMREYTERKEGVIRDVMRRAVAGLGDLSG